MSNNTEKIQIMKNKLNDERWGISERIFKCGVCGLRIDRDLNASLNLEKMAVSSTVSACGVANQTKQCALLPQRSKNKTSNVC